MIVGSRQYYVYRYEGPLNGLENAVVLITYPKDAFLNPKALRAFISMDASLSTRQILDINILAFDKVQIRSSLGIRRFWLMMSLAHFICVTSSGSTTSFEHEYFFFQKNPSLHSVGKSITKFSVYGIHIAIAKHFGIFKS